MLWVHEHFNATKGLLHSAQRPLLDAWAPIILILGIPGNVLAIATLPTLKFSTSGFPTFAMGLAVTDLLLLCLQTTPLWVEARFHYGLGEENDPLCKTLQWFRNSLVMLSEWTIVAMVVHRSWSAVRPLHAYMCNQKKQARMVLLLLTVLIFGINTHALSIFSIRSDSSCGLQRGKSVTGGVAVYFLALMNSWLPLFLVMVSNCILVSALKNSAKVLNACSPRMASRPTAMQKGKKGESEVCNECGRATKITPGASQNTSQGRRFVLPGGCSGLCRSRTQLPKADANIRRLTNTFEQLKNEMVNLGVGNACETCYLAELQQQVISSRSLHNKQTTSRNLLTSGLASSQHSEPDMRTKIEKIAASAEPRIVWEMELRDETEFSQSFETFTNDPAMSQESQTLSSRSSGKTSVEDTQIPSGTQEVLPDASNAWRSDDFKCEESGDVPRSQQRWQAGECHDHSRSSEDRDNMNLSKPPRFPTCESGRSAKKRWRTSAVKVSSVEAFAAPVHQKHKKLYRGMFKTQRNQDKTTAALLALSFAFILLRLPWSVMEVVYFHADHTDREVDQKHDEFLFWYTVAGLLFESTYAVNFYLYILTARPIRQKVGQMFSRCCAKTWR